MSPRNSVTAWRCRSQRSGLSPLVGGPLLLLALGLVSMCIGVVDFDPVDLVRAGSQGRSMRLLMISRVPRILAAALAGSGIAMTGTVIQMSVCNRFASPTTADTTQFAVIGLLLVTLFAPGTSVLVKMLVASACAVTGSTAFLWLLRLLPHRHTPDDVTAPPIGLMLDGVVGVGATFVAQRHDLLQSLGSWTAGDLSRMLADRYGSFQLVALIVLLLCLAADRLTVASLGAETITGLGLSYHRTINLTIMAAIVMTVVSVTVIGSLPFLGLTIPSIIPWLMRGNLHRNLPVIAVSGAVLTLGCDVVGRVVRYPYEVPLSVVIGVVGAGAFTVLILRGMEHS